MAPTEITEAAVTEAMRTVIEPELHRDLVSLNFVRNIKIDGSDVSLTIMLTTPACPLKHVLKRDTERALHEHLSGVGAISIAFDSEVRSDRRIMDKLNLPIKNIIAVSSGKGGVGKSTVSANLAVALALDGARSGILDADIYGPNIPIMLGIEDLPPPQGNKIAPARKFGIEIMSMGFLIPRAEALVWRGPMIHGALSQLFTEVGWSELDYLVVDLPPGTGDAQLSLAQLVPLTGGIVVTGPQEVSVSDALRGVNAFQRLKVPILGVIENMSGDIFGHGGGRRVAEELGLELIGDIALDPAIPKGSDGGVPIVVSHPDGETAQRFRTVARVLAGKVSMLSYAAASA